MVRLVSYALGLGIGIGLGRLAAERAIASFEAKRVEQKK